MSNVALYYNAVLKKIWGKWQKLTMYSVHPEGLLLLRVDLKEGGGGATVRF